MKSFTDWKNEPATDKQLTYIAEMQEFSAFPIPKFTGTTKGEACNYVEKYSIMSNKDDSDMIEHGVPTWHETTTRRARLRIIP